MSRRDRIARAPLRQSGDTRNKALPTAHALEPEPLETVVADWLLKTHLHIRILEAAGRHDLAASLSETIAELFALYADCLPDMPAVLSRMAAIDASTAASFRGRVQ